MNELIESLRNLKVGDKVYGWGEKKPYNVYFNNGRYVVIAKKMFGSANYSIIDLEKEIMGAGDSWQFDVEFDENFEINFNKYLENCKEKFIEEISRRTFIGLDEVKKHQLNIGRNK